MGKCIGVNDIGRPIGQFHHRCKYPDEVIDRIRSLHEDHRAGYRFISRVMGVPRSTVREICLYNRRAQAYAEWRR